MTVNENIKTTCPVNGALKSTNKEACKQDTFIFVPIRIYVGNKRGVINWMIALSTIT